jgi:preprotein translocase subunit SecY
LVGVVLDTLQQIESHLLMRHYDGLMKTGRLKGRNPVAAGATGSVI